MNQVGPLLARRNTQVRGEAELEDRVRNATVFQAVETAIFVVTPAVTLSSPGGNHWLLAAVHSPEDPLSHSVCF